VSDLVVLGSTGSVGEQTLDVAARFPERFRVRALAAGRNVAKLAAQVERFRPELVAAADAAAAAELRWSGRSACGRRSPPSAPAAASRSRTRRCS
jgi:1-deoxy-D-xylulose-5-phosphate reductoisomerase